MPLGSNPGPFDQASVDVSGFTSGPGSPRRRGKEGRRQLRSHPVAWPPEWHWWELAMKAHQPPLPQMGEDCKRPSGWEERQHDTLQKPGCLKIMHPTHLFSFTPMPQIKLWSTEGELKDVHFVCADKMCWSAVRGIYCWDSAGVTCCPQALKRDGDFCVRSPESRELPV